MNDSDRLKLLLDFFDLTASRFAKEIGMDRPGAVFYILSGRNGISKPMQKDILHRFPDVSPDWLATGDGDMFRPESDILSPEPRAYTQEDIRSLVGSVNILSNKIEELLKKKICNHKREMVR